MNPSSLPPSVHRPLFHSQIGAIFAAVGSAVGLGNIWRFPYEAGQNGGGAFLLIYLVLVFVLGVSVMLAEFFIGRKTHQDAVTAMQTLAGKRSAWIIPGYMGVYCALLINGFYFVVAGWTLEYLYQSASGAFGSNRTSEELGAAFSLFCSNPLRPVFWMLVFIGMTHGIINFGVQRGIERVSKIAMPLLFLILLILGVRSLTLPNGMQGLRFLFTPDFSQVTGGTFLCAMSQAFFSLSLGMGCMVTYSSYFEKSTSLVKSAIWITLLDTLVAVLAGIVIFPAVFSFGIAPTQGPDLVFITLPSVFQQMPFGSLWASLFFALLVIAALTSTISLHEVFTVYLQDRFRFSRATSTGLTSFACVVLGVFSSLSLGMLSSFTLGGMTFFDQLDFLSSKILMPMGALIFCVFVGWKIPPKTLQAELTSDGIYNFRIFPFFHFLLRYVVPLAILMIFFGGFLRN
ncbi:MAG: sodium-dependent transporter [Thermoguttaceae bacterium]